MNSSLVLADYHSQPGEGREREVTFVFIFFAFCYSCLYFFFTAIRHNYNSTSVVKCKIAEGVQRGDTCKSITKKRAAVVYLSAPIEDVDQVSPIKTPSRFVSQSCCIHS